MKYRFGLIKYCFCILLSFNAFGVDESCKLDSPIDTKGHGMYEYRLDFTDVDFYENSIFPKQSTNNSNTKKINMQLFNIETNGFMKDIIGGRFDQAGRGNRSLGLSNGYSGDVPEMSSEVKSVNGKDIILTKVKEKRFDKDMVEHEVTKEVQVILNEDKITSIKFTIPVEKYNEDSRRAFITKEYQSLCVKSASLLGVLNYYSFKYTYLN